MGCNDLSPTPAPTYLLPTHLGSIPWRYWPPIHQNKVKFSFKNPSISPIDLPQIHLGTFPYYPKTPTSLPEFPSNDLIPYGLSFFTLFWKAYLKLLGMYFLRFIHEKEKNKRNKKTKKIKKKDRKKKKERNILLKVPSLNLNWDKIGGEEFMHQKQKEKEKDKKKN